MLKHHLRACGGLLALAVVALTVAVPSGAASGPSTKYSFTGEAYGSILTVGNTVKSGPTFRASLGSCTAKSGSISTKTGLASNIPGGVLATKTIDNSVVAGQGPSSASTTATSTVQTASLLGGLITADAVKAVSKATYTQGSGFSFANGSSFVGLNVNGAPIAVTAPNTNVTLPGLGYVVFNEQTRSTTSRAARQVVNMIHLFVTHSNPFGLAIGTNLVVAHAVASISSPLGPGGPVNGSAYGTSVKVGSVVKSDQSALASMPCLGGFEDNEILLVKLNGTMTTGEIYDTALATLTSNGSSGETTSSVHTLNLLNGLVKADVIKADAHGTFNGVTHTLSQSGSAFTNLSVNGQKVASVSPNTQVTIANVGTLYLDRVTKTSRSINVCMVELVVTNANNVFGLPLGTDIRVAVANVSFRD